MGKWVCIFCLIFSSGITFGQIDSLAIINIVKEDIEFLASDSLQGRFPGSYGAELAAKRIENRLKKMGVQPLKKKYRNYFVLQEEEQQILTFNITARINKDQPCKLILVAHYDHLGLGDKHSREINFPIVHNGADDNASGVSIALILTEMLQKKCKDLPYGITIVFTSGHELGLYGANFFVKENESLLKEKPYVLNFDMVGRLENDYKGIGQLYFRVDDDHFWDTSELPKSDARLDIVVKKLDSPLDQTSFHQQKLKAATFSTGIHPDYHKSTDDAKKINYQGIYLIYTFLENYIKGIIGT